VVAALGLLALRPNGAYAAAAGSTNCGNAGIEWVRRLGFGNLELGGMAPTADGGVVVAGRHGGQLRVEIPGAPALVRRMAEPSGGFVLRLGADGSILWVREVGGV